MISIAICDDEKKLSDLVYKRTMQFLKQYNITNQIQIYDNSKNLYYDIEEGICYDLLLLDIEMPGITGMELARLVRQYTPDAYIIFITSHTEYAIDAFELSIFRYIPKNNIDTRLPVALRDITDLIQLQEGQSYTIQNARQMVNLPYRDILYINRDGKNSILYTSRAEYRVRKSLARVYGELCPDEFIFIDRGCIANISHIMTIDHYDIILKDGTALQLSQSRLTEVRNILHTYWSEHL